VRWAGALARADSARPADGPELESSPTAGPAGRETSPDPFSRPRQESARVPEASTSESARSRMDARQELAKKSANPPESKAMGAPEVRRSSEAQALFEAAQRQIAAGGVSAAIVLLRRALSLSHGDPEISALLGRLAFKDRNR
jgi:hypothetical protein